MRRLQQFLAVAHRGHFTRAAEELHMSQSALSSSIRALERELGVALFERTTRTVLLTAAGRALHAHARQLVGDMAAAHAAVAEIAQVRAGTLAVGTVQTFVAVDLPALLARFHADHPAVEVHLREATSTELVDGLTGGDLDLAFVALDTDPLPPGPTVLRDYEEELVVVVARDHPLTGSACVALTDLAPFPFIDFEAGPGLQTTVAALFARADVQRRITFRIGDMTRLIELVRHGLGVAVVPEPIARTSDLTSLCITPRASRRLALVARSDAPTNPAARALLGLLPVRDGRDAPDRR